MGASTSTTATKAEPFSFEELTAPTNGEGGEDPVLPTTTIATVVASDGVELAVHVYKPTTTTTNTTKDADTTALVFYHGGGAHAGAGYQHLGRGLSEKFGITVYLPDLRGHGSSGGPRGDAPSRERIWSDIDEVLAWVAANGGDDKNNNVERPRRRILLGGHSSGGGLVVNYATRAATNDGATTVPLDGYVLVAPELGYASGTARPGRTEFASVSILAFIANGIFGILGHYHAVRFKYPAKILEDDPGMVASNTVNMANAITPDQPKEQMSALSGGDGGGETPAPPPVGLWVGADDELFAPEAVTAFVDTKGSGRVAEVLPGKTHLGILVEVHESIGRWIRTTLDG